MTNQSATPGLAASNIRYFGLELSDATLPGLDEVGGKGMNLCKLTHAKFPVPPGFVVTTEAYIEFISAGGLGTRIRELADSINPNDVDELGVIAAKIRALFAETPAW